VLIKGPAELNDSVAAKSITAFVHSGGGSHPAGGRTLFGLFGLVFTQAFLLAIATAVPGSLRIKSLLSFAGSSRIIGSLGTFGSHNGIELIFLPEDLGGRSPKG